MKITKSKTKDLMATLKVEVVEKDYRENVDKIDNIKKCSKCSFVFYSSLKISDTCLNI